jgi:shikimate kinase
MDKKNQNFDKKAIVLTGIMGSGKSTIGAKLAEKMGYYFIDSDREIEDNLNMSISDIFAQKGEEYFREIERSTVEKIILRDENMVLSLGGGAFLDEKTRDLIAKKAISVWLYCDLEILLRRISGNNRPLLNNVDRRKVLEDLIKKRYPIYEQADIGLDTGSGNSSLVQDLFEKINIETQKND